MLSVAAADESSLRPDLITMMLKQQDSQEGGLPDEEILDEIVMFYVVMCDCAQCSVHHDVTLVGLGWARDNNKLAVVCDVHACTAS